MNENNRCTCYFKNSFIWVVVEDINKKTKKTIKKSSGQRRKVCP
jgi:hypothetical protein